MSDKWKAETKSVWLQNGAELVVGNSPDGQWWIRMCETPGRVVGDFWHQTLLFATVKNPRWFETPFATPQEAIDFAAKQLRTRPCV